MTLVLNWVGEICLSRDEVAEKMSSFTSPTTQPKAKIPLCFEWAWRSRYRQTLVVCDYGEARVKNEWEDDKPLEALELAFYNYKWWGEIQELDDPKLCLGLDLWASDLDGNWGRGPERDARLLPFITPSGFNMGIILKTHISRSWFASGWSEIRKSITPWRCQVGGET